MNEQAIFYIATGIAVAIPVAWYAAVKVYQRLTRAADKAAIAQHGATEPTPRADDGLSWEERLELALVHDEFDEAWRNAGIASQLRRVEIAAAATLAEMRERWGITDADLTRYAEEQDAADRAAEIDRLADNLIANAGGDWDTIREQWAAAILSPTRRMPIIRPREMAGAGR